MPTRPALDVHQARPLQPSLTTQAAAPGRFKLALTQARDRLVAFLQHPLTTLKSLFQRELRVGTPPAPRVHSTPAPSSRADDGYRLVPTDAPLLPDGYLRIGQVEGRPGDGDVTVDNGGGPLPDGDVTVDHSSEPLPDGYARIGHGESRPGDGYVTVDNGSGPLPDGYVTVDSSSESLPDGDVPIEADGVATLDPPSDSPADGSDHYRLAPRDDSVPADAPTMTARSNPPPRDGYELSGESQGDSLYPVGGPPGGPPVSGGPTATALGVPAWALHELQAERQRLGQTQLAPPSDPVVFKSPKLVRLATQGPTAKPLQAAFTRFGQALLKPTDRSAATAAAPLGQLLGAWLGSLPRAQQHQFVLDPRGFTHEVVQHLQHDLGLRLPPVDQMDATQRKLLDDLLHATLQHTSDRLQADGRLVIDGKTYRPVDGARAEQGHFGAVRRYRGDDGSELAVKEALIDEADAALEGRQMIEAQGHANVLSLTAALPGPNRRILLVTPYAPGGTATQLMDKVARALKDGAISHEMAQAIELTLLRDVLQGAQHLHANKGMAHLDLHGGNVLIGADGQAQIADFGQARDARRGDKLPQTINGGIAAPELKAPRPPGGAPVNPQSDTYSIGLLLQRAVFGKLTPNPDTRSVSVVGRMIAAMTDADADRRPTVQALLDSMVFNEEAIGSPATRATMTALGLGLPLPPA